MPWKKSGRHGGSAEEGSPGGQKGGRANVTGTCHGRSPGCWPRPARPAIQSGAAGVPYGVDGSSSGRAARGNAQRVPAGRSK